MCEVGRAGRARREVGAGVPVRPRGPRIVLQLCARGRRRGAWAPPPPAALWESLRAQARGAGALGRGAPPPGGPRARGWGGAGRKRGLLSARGRGGRCRGRREHLLRVTAGEAAAGSAARGAPASKAPGRQPRGRALGSERRPGPLGRKKPVLRSFSVRSKWLQILAESPKVLVTPRESPKSLRKRTPPPRS